jgi:hypothetical protein
MNQKVSVREVFEIGVHALRFRRAMVGDLRELWMQMQESLRGIELRNESDTLGWTLTESGVYSVKSFYSAMQFSRVVPYKFMWKAKIPLRVKLFFG